MPKSFEVQVAEQLAEIRQEIKRLKRPIPAWQDWTPTVTQSGSVAVTVTYARYTLVGNLVVGVGRLAVTGSGSAGNNIIIGGQPTAIQHGNTHGGLSMIGGGAVHDSGTAYYHGALMSVGATDWRILGHADGYIGGNPSFALANGDTISFQAAYER
jgi:hypothetical protein